MPTGTFVLADLGGYTRFLSDVGIEHAKEITSHLFNRMVEVKPDRWKVGNVVGDCLFLYNETQESPDEIFAYVRGVYESFRDSIAEVAAGSTCRCGACDRTEDLTLKFVVHRGEFAVHEVVGRQEVIGPAIVAAHRLLKNSVSAREYVLCTEAVAEAAAASGFPTTIGRDDYDDVGAMPWISVDLQPVRKAVDESRVFHVTESNADVTASVDIAAPPELVWAVTLDADKALRWAPTIVGVAAVRGEPGTLGSVHTCLHGDGVKMVHLTIAVDAVGYRRTDRLWNVPVVRELYLTFEARPSAMGTTFSFHYALRPGVPIPTGVTKSDFLAVLRQHAEGDAQGLKTLCEAEVRAQGAEQP